MDSHTRQRASLPIECVIESRSGSGAPLLEIDFQRTRYPGNGQPIFSPLRLPERARFRLSDVGPHMLGDGTLSLTARLVPGVHTLPLAGGHPLRALVSDGVACAHVRVEVGRPEQHDDGPMLRGLELRFDPPLVLLNLLDTLREVQGLFRDHTLAGLLARLPGQWWSLPARQVMQQLGATALDAGGRLGSEVWQRLAPRLSQRLGMGAAGRQPADRKQRPRLAATDDRWETIGEPLPGYPAEAEQEAAPERAPLVHLTRALGRPRWREGRRQWELELSFSGHIGWLERVVYPFTDVVLPSVVLPVPYATIRHLLSPTPLASGDLRLGRLAPLPLVRALLAAVRLVEGEIGQTVELPPLALSLVAVDRTRVSAGVQLPARAALAARLALRRSAVAAGQRAAPISGEPTDDRGQIGEFALSCHHLTVTFPDHPQARLAGTAEAEIAVDLRSPSAGDPRSAPGHRLSASAQLSVLPGSQLPRLDIGLASRHPLAEGGTSLDVGLKQLALEGSGRLGVEGGRLWLAPAGSGLTLSAQLRVPDQTQVRRARGSLAGGLDDGRLSVWLRPGSADDGDSSWQAGVVVEALLRQRLELRVVPIPELHIEDNTLCGAVDCSFRLDGGAQVHFPDGSGRPLSFLPTGKLELVLGRAEATIDGRRLEFPAGTTLCGSLRQGSIAAVGHGHMAIDLAWDLQGQTCLLRGDQRSVSLLPEELRRGALTLHISPGGHFSVSGGDSDEQGLYGVRFFNALLRPTADSGHLLDILHSEGTLTGVVSALEILSPEVARLLATLRDMVFEARRILRREGIAKPADFIPRPRIARTLSMLLLGNPSLEERLVPLIQAVTEGRGLPLAEAKQLFREALGSEHRIDYELDGLLRWFDLVTRPSAPLPAAVAVAEPPLALDPRYVAARQGWPQAAEIQRLVANAEAGPDLVERLAAIAPYLTAAQVDFLLEHARPDWSHEAGCRLAYVREVKRRVAAIEEGYGGIRFAAQTMTIASFLGEAVGPLPALEQPDAPADTDDPSRVRHGAAGESDSDHNPAPDSDSDPDPDWPPPCALGPEEISVLLRAGLAAGRQGMQAQIHNRLLLELCRARPGSFLLEVLVEMGGNNPRALSGVLFAFLNQDQDELRQPIDLVALLEDKLGLRVPRQEEYVAGGRRARESYYQALSELADRIHDAAGPYLSRKEHLQVVRRPLPPTMPRLSSAAGGLKDQARRAIAAADELGRSCDFTRGRTGPKRHRAQDAYRQAFAACTALLDEQPTAFQLPWFKQFWLRNEEALKVLSVVRNHQQEIDEVRRWLAIQSGRAAPESEQRLVEQVVRTLYLCAADQERLLADPLLRLLIDPEPGDYDFTVISCMGVVTDGALGHELEDTFRRLGERRGVQVIRANTGLFRSVDYNARTIVQAIARSETPWGYIGYSQGCPNGLWAESLLAGGTPAEQRLLERFVCRNLLFSAANGSAHGSSSSVKFLAAMVEGERFLKHYQALYSRQAVEVVHRTLRAFLDSALFVQTLGGTHSLTFEFARTLHRDGQFLPTVPTSTTRGVVTADRLPEMLEYLYYCHQHLMPGAPHDTQVAVEEAIGAATRVSNQQTAAFARCDMGSLCQATHHWSPLTVEIEFVTTPRDIERAVYQGPKDRHVFPWIEVNARFGRIRRRERTER